MAKATFATEPPDNHDCPKHPEYNIVCAWCNGEVPAASDNVDKELDALIDKMITEYATTLLEARRSVDFVMEANNRGLLKDDILALITSREQELLSRVDKEVIGEPDPVNESQSLEQNYANDVGNAFRAKQRQKLNKLGDSL